MLVNHSASVQRSMPTRQQDEQRDDGEDDRDQADPPTGPSSPASVILAVVRSAGRPAAAPTTGAAPAGIDRERDRPARPHRLATRPTCRRRRRPTRRHRSPRGVLPRRSGAARRRSASSRSGRRRGRDRGRQRSADAQDRGLRHARRPLDGAAPPGNRRIGPSSAVESTRSAGSGPVETLDGTAERGKDGLGELVRSHRRGPRGLERNAARCRPCGVPFEPARAAAMRPNELAETVLSAFCRAVEGLHRP